MQPTRTRWMIPIAFTALVTGAGSLIGCTGSDGTPEPAAEPSGPPEAVSALGRIEPDVGVIDVAAPAGERIRELRVQEGSEVQAGDVLAVFESHPERLAALGNAQARLAEALQNLARSRKLEPAAVESRRTVVAKIEATLRLAESDLARNRSLESEGVIPSRDLEHQQTVVDEVRAELENARALLRQETLERAEAVSDAQTRVRTAESVVEQAQALLDQSVLKAPSPGRVLDIAAWQGESADAEGVLQLGTVGRMMVVAEIYETDVQFVRRGQTATVTSPALPQDLTGKVEQIAVLVQRNDVFDTDPRADRDARVFEARILLDQPAVADDFVHLQVDVVVDIDGAEAASGSP